MGDCDKGFSQKSQAGKGINECWKGQNSCKLQRRGREGHPDKVVLEQKPERGEAVLWIPEARGPVPCGWHSVSQAGSVAGDTVRAGG